MNISSAIVKVKPEKMISVRQALASQPGVEIHIEDEHGTLIVTVEDDQLDILVTTISNFLHIDGLLSVTPSYHYFEQSDPQTGSAI